ncbi:MAG: peptidoglycan-associated lipoprotein Pal [Syntrophorhabdales bacterium]|jgi:peptidoglycan-associated lipoprotein
MQKALIPVCLVIAILLIHGCASKTPSAPLSERGPATAAPEQPASVGGAAGQEGKASAITEEELARAEQERRRRAAEEAIAAHLHDVYFDFDSYVLRPADISTLRKMAEWLASDQSVRVTIEGYCDERGTTEYNLALGQKRAEAAKDYLVKSGVSDTRIRTVSYGKEAPVDAGHTEDAWARNRRDHFLAQ